LARELAKHGADLPLQVAAQVVRHPLAEKVENVEVGRVAASGSMAEHARTVEFDAARLGA